MSSLVAGDDPAFDLVQSGLTCCSAQELERCERGWPDWLWWWWPVLMCWRLPGEAERAAVLSHTHWARGARMVPPGLLWAERLTNTLRMPITSLCLATGSSLRGCGWTQVPPYWCIVITLLHGGAVPQDRSWVPLALQEKQRRRCCGLERQTGECLQ